MTNILPIPCPFCGCTTITISEGYTPRWAVAECDNCGATIGEVRINTMKSLSEDENRAAVINEWNRRTAINPNADKDARIAELERKLAEQQAINKRLQEMTGSLLNPWEKLNNLLAEAKLEINNIRTVGVFGDFTVRIEFYSCRAASAFATAMLAAAPKPQGE